MAAASHNPPESIFALTYNICWGCMQGDTRDPTGLPVVSKCIQTPPNVCPKNITALIDTLESKYGQELDLVGTQESSNIYDTLHSQSTALKKMYRVHCKFGSASHVSFYNPKKFILKACASFNIANYGGGF